MTRAAAPADDRGREGPRLGIDELGFTPALLAELRALLPTTALVDARETFRPIRAVKTPEEVERLRGAAQIAARSIAGALSWALPASRWRTWCG